MNTGDSQFCEPGTFLRCSTLARREIVNVYAPCSTCSTPSIKKNRSKVEHAPLFLRSRAGRVPSPRVLSHLRSKEGSETMKQPDTKPDTTKAIPSRYLARDAQARAAGAPVVEVFDTGEDYVFWCPYCVRWHKHGRGEGHRVPRERSRGFHQSRARCRGGPGVSRTLRVAVEGAPLSSSG